ncbi:MAG: 2-oxoacid:ferredoxin oxidoreductase subunit beta [Armatimonadetes bacterium]|nr:2-oxoacid:ferredoxin oxidoreductase subunit beta [Armatimonadota bacterium]
MAVVEEKTVRDPIVSTIIDVQTLKDLEGPVDPDWCPGCGDFAVLKSLKEALIERHIQPHQALIVSGIGCSSNLPGFINAYGIHSLHGRALPVATGVKLANHHLHVIAVGGDGDGYGIGLSHLIHAARRNLDLTYIVMNNEIYGLTTGQASPTSMLDMRTKSTPFGCAEMPINPIALGIVSGATFVARTFSGDQKHMAKIFAQGIAHRGFSLIDCMSPCVTFNKVNTYPWFKERCYRVEDEANYNPYELMMAMEKAYEWGARIPLGVIFRAERPTYEDSEPVLKQGPVVDQPMGITREMFDQLLAETM